jgi:hypothetical protein
VEWLDLEAGYNNQGHTHNAPLVGFSGGFAVDDFIILIPNFSSEYSGVVARLRHGDFSYATVESVDLREMDSSLVGFMNGFTDGTWGYLVPYYNGMGFFGEVVRINVATSPFSNAQIQMIDLPTELNDPTLVGFRGGFVHSGYAYYTPYIHHTIVRIPTADFTASAVEKLTLSTLDTGLTGFSSGFGMSNRIYLAPMFADGYYNGLISSIRTDMFTMTPDSSETGNVAMVDVKVMENENAALDTMKGYVNAFYYMRLSFTVNYVENGEPLVLDAYLSLAEVDQVVFTAAMVTIEPWQNGDILMLPNEILNGDVTSSSVYFLPNSYGVSANWEASTGTLRLQGSALKEEYESTLQSMTYWSPSDDPGLTPRVVTVEVNGRLVQKLGVTVTAVDDPMYLEQLNTRIMYLDGSPPVLLCDQVLILDPEFAIQSQYARDMANTETLSVAQLEGVLLDQRFYLEGVRAEIDKEYEQNADYLGLANETSYKEETGLNVTFNEVGGYIDLRGHASLVTYQRLMRALTYETFTDNRVVRRIRFYLFNGTHHQSVGTMEVAIVSRLVGIYADNIQPQSSEAGDAATFSVMVTEPPTAPVLIAITSNNAAEGETDPTFAIISHDNYMTGVPVSVTGRSDALDDGDVPYYATIVPLMTDDRDYLAHPQVDVHLVNLDNPINKASVTADPIFCDTTENGNTRCDVQVFTTFWHESFEEIKITVTTLNVREGSLLLADNTAVSSTELILATSNATAAFTIFGVDDEVDDEDVNYLVQLRASIKIKGATRRKDIPPAKMTSSIVCKNIDDDTADVLIDRTCTTTSEAGEPCTFTVRLTSEPFFPVTFNVQSNNEKEGNVTVGRHFQITKADWQQGVDVTVGGMNDEDFDQDVAYKVTVASTSVDTAYSGREFVIDLVNLDNDIAELEVNQNGQRLTGVASHVDETGLRKNFTVELPKPPSAAVTIDLASSDETEGVIDPKVLIFDKYNWNISQTVWITGVDDDEADGAVGFRIEFDTTSSDAAVDKIKWFFYMYCFDDDSLLLSTKQCEVYESGQKCTLQVELPVWQQGEFDELNYTIVSKDPSIASVYPTYIRFTEHNWHLPQVVNVSAVDNYIDNVDVMTKVFFNGTLAFKHHAADGIDGMRQGISTSGWGLCKDEGARRCAVGADLGTTWACEYGIQCDPDTIMKKATTIHVVDVTAIDDDTASIAITPLEPTIPLKQQLNGDWTAADNDQLFAYVNNDPSQHVTDEGGLLAWRFSVVLTSEPINDVTLLAVSSNDEEGVACHTRLECPRTLHFTSINWMVPQTVLVRGEDDDTVDYDKMYIISTGPSVSNDPLYDAHFSFSHSFLNRDDDHFGVVVSAEGSSSEAGRPALINARLLSMPKAPILFSISSNVPSEGIPQPAIFVLSQQNWRDGVNIESVGQADTMDDGDITYILSCTPITTQDPEYLAEKPQYVYIVNEDDPVNKLEIDITTDNTQSPLSIGYDITTPINQACVVYEDSSVLVDGHTRYCTIKIQPTTWWVHEGAYQELRVTVRAGNTAEGMLVRADGSLTPTLMLVFQNHTWAAGATVRLTGVDDQKVDGFGRFDVRVTAEIDAFTRAEDVITKPISFKKIGGGRVVKAATVDDDTAAVIFVKGCNVTSEAGDRCTYMISLQTEPSWDVVFHSVSDNENEGKVEKGSTVTMTPENWMIPQEIEIIGQDDAAFDKTQAYKITVGPSVSYDPMYANWKTVIDMENTDNDIAEMIILQDGNPIRGFAKHTDETGAQQSFTIQLPPDSEPRAAVMIEISSSDQTEVMVIPSIIVFTPTDFMIPQTVQLVGQDDNDMDGDTIVRITLTTHSTDEGYADVSWFFYMYNNDDDGLTLSRDSCVVSEWGDSCDVDVSMRAWRDEEYKLMEFSVFSSDEGEGYGTPESIRFNISNWWIPQTVTVHGVDDLIDDGTVQFRIDLVGILTFKEGFENEKNSFSVTLDVKNEDDDTAGVVVKQLANTTNEQGSMTATYTVKLLTEPVKPVYIPSQVLTTPGESPEGQVKPAQLKFTSENWYVEQTVTVSGVDDWVKDYEQPFKVQIGPAYSQDIPYKGQHMSVLDFVNLDDDEVGLLAKLELEEGGEAPAGTRGETSEDGQIGPGKILVRLNSEPKSTVLFTVSRL